MSQIKVDAKACRRCGACVQVCALAGVFELRDGVSFAVRPEACWGCGQCVAVCPADAIDHDEFPLEKCPLIDPRGGPASEQLVAILRARRSTRTYADRPVPRDVVRELVSVTRWGPSASNSQDVDWVAIDDRARLTELSKTTLDRVRRLGRLAASPVLRPLVRLMLGRETARSAARAAQRGDELIERWAKGRDPLFHNAPVVLIGHTRGRRPFARDDAVFAAYNLMLAAERQGLATCQIGIFQLAIDHSRTVRRMLGLPEGRRAQIVLTLGYPQFVFRRVVPRRVPELIWNRR